MDTNPLNLLPLEVARHLVEHFRIHPDANLVNYPDVLHGRATTFIPVRREDAIAWSRFDTPDHAAGQPSLSDPPGKFLSPSLNLRSPRNHKTSVAASGVQE